jgi:hypothetical protein
MGRRIPDAIRVRPSRLSSEVHDGHVFGAMRALSQALMIPLPVLVLHVLGDCASEMRCAERNQSIVQAGLWPISSPWTAIRWRASGSSNT